MAAERDMALSLVEQELELRRRHLQALAADLIERMDWLQREARVKPAVGAPLTDWQPELVQQQHALARELAALHERRLAWIDAADAALDKWQLQLHAVAEVVRRQERGSMADGPTEPPPPQPRAALKRPVSAPQLSVEPAQAELAQTEPAMQAGGLPPRDAHELDWRRTVQMPQAKSAPLTKTAKRQTTQVQPMHAWPEPDDPRDLVPLPTPHDLPVLPPRASQAQRPRTRHVTEPFAAALDLDGVYVQRSQVALDGRRRRLAVQAKPPHAQAEPAALPDAPHVLKYRSREGDQQEFPVRPAARQLAGGALGLILDISDWSEAQLEAFAAALTTLPD